MPIKHPEQAYPTFLPTVAYIKDSGVCIFLWHFREVNVGFDKNVSAHRLATTIEVTTEVGHADVPLISLQNAVRGIYRGEDIIQDL